jgi:hypothetical protein
MIDPDKINNADSEKVAKATFTILDRIQHFPAHEQVLASAALFLVMAEHHKVQPQDVFTVTKNLMFEKTRMKAEFAALLDYVRYEIKRA